MHVTQICLSYWPLSSWIINEFEKHVSIIFSEFQLCTCTGWGEGELQENFEKDALFSEGTEKWQKNMNTAVLSQGILSRIFLLKWTGTGFLTKICRKRTLAATLALTGSCSKYGRLPSSEGHGEEEWIIMHFWETAHHVLGALYVFGLQTAKSLG